MMSKRPEEQDAKDPKSGSGKAWTKPSFIELRAGSAEAIPGTAIPDSSLEAIGS